MTASVDNAVADLQRANDELRRQLDECHAERDEALAQQTAIAEVLGVINSSPGDLQPIFDVLLDRAARLCAPAFGIITSWDGERYYRVAVSPADLADLGFEVVVPPPGAPGHRLVNGEDVIRVDDAAAPEVAHYPAMQATVRRGGRSYVTVALRKDRRLPGAISMYRREMRPFTDKEVALLQNFARQAVIAIENARLINETREALEQQTATAEVLSVINLSPGDLAPVFDAMLDRALRLCDAAFGTLWTYDGELVHPVAVRGVTAAHTEFIKRQGAQLPGPANLRIIRGERVVQIMDMQESEGYRSGVPIARSLVDNGGRTSLVLGLYKDDLCVEILNFSRTEVRPFTDKQIALLQNFAAQAVIAMENARLITETREALEQQTATAEVLGVINSSPGDLTPVFDAILEKAHLVCDSPSGSLQIREGDRLRAVATRGLPETYASMLRSGFIAQRVGVNTVTQVDIAEFAEANPDNEILRFAAQEVKLRTVLFVPLIKDGVVIGRIAASRYEFRPFTGKQIALLQNFAQQAVIAVENARLLGELRQRTDEVDELNRGLEARVAEQVDELGRVGRLKRFLAPQLAELIVSQGDEKILESHRREIVVVFCDLRGYTAFTETAEPEEVLDFLREYHGALGPLVSQFEGTLDQFSGDGIMVFFNDPMPIPDPAERAVNMAVAMREAAGTLIAAWRPRDRELGFGAGIAQGYATLGQIGFSERSGYTATGTVCNLAARLCAEAKDGQILITGRIAAAVGKALPVESLGSLTLKGLSQPVSTFNVRLTAGQPTLRIIEGGPPSG